MSRRNGRLERVRAEKARLEARATEDKPIRPYRSQAERTAVKQRNIQIGLSVIILLVSVTSLLANLGVL